MALADTARLIASLELQDRFSGPMKGALGTLGQAETRFGRIGKIATQGVKTAASNIAKIGLVAGAAIAGIGVASVKSGLQTLAELEQLTKQTEAVIASTGGKAGVTAAQVGELAESLEDLTTVDDKVIRDGQNLLLTFTGIGKDVFPDATKAMVNLSVAMAGGDAGAVDLQGSAIQLGKALNDPVKGITALTRVGVSFTEQQKKQIEAMVEAGDVAGAQRIILQELETEFGNAGEAAGQGYAADMRRFNDAVQDAQVALARGFLPIIKEVTQFMNEKLRDPKVIAALEDLGKQGAGLLREAFTAIKQIPWAQVGEAFKLMGQGAKAAWDIFNGMPDWLKTAVLTGWGLNKLTGGAVTGIISELGKGLIKGILGINATTVIIKAGVVQGGGGAGVPAAGGAGAMGLGATGVAGALVSAAGVATIVGAITLTIDQIGRLPQLIGGVQALNEAKTVTDLKTGFRDVIEGSTISNWLVGPYRAKIEELLGLTSGNREVLSESLNRQTAIAPAINDLGAHIATERAESNAAMERRISGGLAGLSADFGAKWQSVAAELGAKIGHIGPAFRRALAEELGVPTKAISGLREGFKSALSAEFGLTESELINLRQQSGGWNAVLADKLGISVERLNAIRTEAAQTTGAINKLELDPTIKVTTNVATTLSVSARTIASEINRYTAVSRQRQTAT